MFPVTFRYLPRLRRSCRYNASYYLVFLILDDMQDLPHNALALTVSQEWMCMALLCQLLIRGVAPLSGETAALSYYVTSEYYVES